MATTLIKFRASAQRGEIIEIQTAIRHPMETGYRPGADGKIAPRDIIRRFTCHYDGELVFAADLYPAIAANPYIAFSTVATASGTLRFTWEGDHGFRHTQDAAISVT